MLCHIESELYGVRWHKNWLLYNNSFETILTKFNWHVNTVSNLVPFYEDEEYKYLNVKPKVGVYAVKLVGKTNKSYYEGTLEFENSLKDAECYQLFDSNKIYLQYRYLEYLWKTAFAAYPTLSMDDLIRGLSLKSLGKKSISGKIGSALSKQEIKRVGDKIYRHIVWKRRTLMYYPIPKSAIYKMRKRAAVIKKEPNFHSLL